MKNNEELRKIIRQSVKLFYENNKKNQKIIPGKTMIPISRKIYDEKEMLLGVEAILDGWWTEGRFAKEFQHIFSKYLGVKYVSLVNSGSSANLIAFSALTSKSLGERRIKAGDEVITVAMGFSTTINPIIIYGCVPVFIDVDINTINADISSVRKAITKKTKAIMMAHTFGNPFCLKEIVKIAKKHNLWLIEDCCDALGSKYDGKYVGTFGDIATFSFYPAHHITMGEGGAVMTNNPFLYRAVKQFRDWGRDCWCDTGCDNTCGKRFKWKLGKLPYGYDHKYIYSQIGYNLKITDMQAAIGVAQLGKLPKFIKKRKENFKTLYDFFKKHEKYFVLPKWEKESDPSWFGYLIVVRDSAPFKKLEMVNFLESCKIATRSPMAGNLLRHPAYEKIKCKVIGDLKNSDKIMSDGFWIGVYPGIGKREIKYMIEKIEHFLEKYEENKK